MDDEAESQVVGKVVMASAPMAAVRTASTLWWDGIVIAANITDEEAEAAFRVAMEGLDAGADDYVVKPFSFDELVARMRVQERRAPAIRPEPARLNDRDRSLTCVHGSVALTEREYGLLTHLLAHAGEPRSRGVLFDTLWAKDGSANENVVDVYIGYLRKKLSKADFGFEIRTVRHRGFLLDGLAPLRSKD